MTAVNPMRAASVTDRSATLRRRAATTGVVALSLFCTMMAATLAGTAHTPVWNVTIGAILNFVAGIALVWRHQAPWVVLGMALAGPLFFATDATAALIALFALASHVRDRRLAVASLAVYTACLVSLVYDAFRRRDYSVLTIGARIREGEPIPEWNVSLWVPFSSPPFSWVPWWDPRSSVARDPISSPCRRRSTAPPRSRSPSVRR